MTNWRIVYDDALEGGNANKRHPNRRGGSYSSGCSVQLITARHLEHSQSLNDEFWMDRIPGTQTIVKYVAVEYERLVIVKELRG